MKNPIFRIHATASAENAAASPLLAQQATDAAFYGFSPEACGVVNTKALQAAVDKGGVIVVSRPGTYQVAGTVYVGSNTSLKFDEGVFLKKVADIEPFSHVLLNRGAITKTYDEHISVDGLRIIVNGIDVRAFREVYGLHGQLAFFYVKDLRITRFQCLDLGKLQYAIHVCTFEDLLVDDVIIKGDKDGVHLGRGKRFIIRNAVFQTFDDAVALNAHDYDVGNPELGWIEDGVVENCRDLSAPTTTGYFCRILAGAWIDWNTGMEVQKSDTVVSNGRLYRVFANPDGTKYISTTQPSHASGSRTLDGITWFMVQNDVTYTAGVRNVTFRHIVLEKSRGALFSIHFDNDKYSRSFYPGATVPNQEGIIMDDVRVMCGQPIPLIRIVTPVDAVTVMNSSLRNNGIIFDGGGGKTILNLIGCTFLNSGRTDLVVNSYSSKTIVLKTSKSVIAADNFCAAVVSGNAAITIDSDLPGLKTSSSPNNSIKPNQP